MCKRSDTERGELPSSTNLIASNFSSNVLLRIWTVSVVSNFVGSLQYIGSLFRVDEPVPDDSLPAISKKSVKKLHEKMKEWKLHSHLDWKLQQVGIEIESQVRGWYNYYNKFGKTEFVKVMNHLNMVLAYWIRRKYKRFHRKPIVKALIWLQEIASKDRSLFYHWQRGQTPRLCLCTKRWVWRAVWGETFTHGFCERVRVKLPRSTRPMTLALFSMI